MRPRVIIFMGLPGTGSEAQGEVLSALMGIPMFCFEDRTLDLAWCLPAWARHSASSVSTRDVNQALAHWIEHTDCHGGFLLNGYPVTLEHALFLDRELERLGMPRPTIVQISAPLDTLVTRLMGRRRCSTCGRWYNVRPAQEARCEKDGAVLVPGREDTEAVIRARLAQCQKSMDQVHEHYLSTADFHELEGLDHPGLVLEAIEASLGLCNE